MANNCSYSCRIVGRTRESVQQIVNALRYKDLKTGYYLCRIYSAEQDGEILEDGGFFYATVIGDCAWSVNDGMISEEYGRWRGLRYGEPEFHVFRDSLGNIGYANLAITMPKLCKVLSCGVEIWSAEEDGQFQEHYIIHSDGELVVKDSCEWIRGYDMDGDGYPCDPNPEKDEGGFKNYLRFSDCWSIYG